MAYKTTKAGVKINKYGVRIGDVLLSDKTYVSPLSDFDKTKVIGYVACFDATF